MPDTAENPRLLSQSDPAPVAVINPDGASPVFLLCEHAGRAVPQRLAGLGLDAAEMDKHIAWDIGAEAVARRLSAHLDAALVLQRYSRLVIDTNRPLAARDCIPEVSDRVVVPGNQGLTADDRQQRYDQIHKPLHDTVARMLDTRAAAGRPGVFLSVHSFTPVLAGQVRDMQVGLLFNRDRRLADALGAGLRRVVPDAKVAMNAPYNVTDDGDYAIPVHGEARGIPNVLVELRNDLIADTAGQDFWAKHLYDALTIALNSLETSP